MKEVTDHSPGWDAKTIADVANRYYGGFRNMFQAHRWEAAPDKMMVAAPANIVRDYGSVRLFEEAHRGDSKLFPMESIKSVPPNVWLTSFWEFHPEEWGFLGFSLEHQRRTFLEEAKPGVLVVIYGAGKASKDELGRILGILQCSHEVGNARDFMSPAAWLAKESNPDERGKWDFAVQATRAWKIAPESRMQIREFAPDATATEAWQYIGAQGKRLSAQESSRILKLELQEVDVYGGAPILGSSSGPALDILAPSKAGPVSKNPFVTRESEGPKHLYVLRLRGDTSAFLGNPAGGKSIIKAGFSGSPETRCADFNRALPRGAFRWEVFKSGAISGFERYRSSDHAKAGERVMHQILCRPPSGSSLGGEFFLAEETLIEEAWSAANIAAKKYKK